MLASTSVSTLNSTSATASRHNFSHNFSQQPNQIVSQSYKIITQYGDMLVVKQSLQSQQQQLQHQQSTCSSSSPISGHHHHHQQGAADQQQQQQQQQQQLTQRPVIMTFHDIGLNSELQFSNFCECDEVKLMLQTFTMLHVNLIGQEFKPGAGSGSSTCSQVSASPGAPCDRLPDEFKYPTVEQLAECIVDVCAQMRVRSFIGLAVGAGAYIAGSLALMRPDLVDGLFLINPVFSSCSITEWLYFKMSAIASNQSVHSWTSGKPADTPAGHAPATPAGDESPKQQSGFRRLLHAAHIHLPADSGAAESSRNAAEDSSPDSRRSRQPPGARLRQLIFSRHIRLANQHQQQQHHHHQVATTASPGSRTSSMSSDSSSPKLERQQQVPGDERGASPNRRPPIEYLMYHHFGPTSARRCSDSNVVTPCGSLVAAGSKSSLTGNESPSIDSPSSRAARRLRRRTGRRDSNRSQDSLDRSSTSGQPVPSGTGASSSSQSGTPAHRGQRARSGSLCLSASYLASMANERQRAAHMQAVYRQYFGQLNAHNLWLLAHSFAKRRTLNLRKDCGAAAHAAAAAATLGTSICTAFVGVQVTGPPCEPGHTAAVPQTGTSASNNSSSRLSAIKTNTGATQQQHNHTSAHSREQLPQVAGTKVKRTFTCQTLIMCSSVQTHCERAFKLMSLLNPLQATWIKTDHLLVLEERPDKVCQALRLFLQGIGYSMSTYERRLRLSSQTGSQSSADSTGSGRSLSEKG